MPHAPIWAQLLDLATSVTNLAATWFVQSTLVIGLGILAGWALRRWEAAVQSAIYRVTLVAAIACPTISFLSARLELSPAIIALPAVPEVLIVEHPQPSDVPRVSADAALPGATAATPSNSTVERQASATRSVAESVHAAPAAAARWSASAWPAITVVLVSFGWLAGSTLLLARLTRAHLQMAQMRRSAIAAPGEQQRLCRELSDRLGVTPPTLVISPFVNSPCLAGIIWPSILLPEEPPGMPSASVLVHELAHLRRGDFAWNLARQATCAALFFQPLAWRLSRLLETTAEEVCDDYVVQHGHDRQTYAELLLSLAKSSVTPASSAVVPLISLRSLLAQRVARILDRTRGLSLGVSAKALCPILATGLAATMAASALRCTANVETISLSAVSPPEAQASDNRSAPKVASGAAGDPTDYKVGDRVVAVRTAPIETSGGVVDRAFMGFVYDVERIDGDKLWVASKTPGWLDKRHVVPFAKAVGYFSDLIERGQYGKLPRQARAVVLMTDGNYEAAAADFKALIEQDPKDHTVWNDLGRVQLKSGDLDGAVASFSEAIRLRRAIPVYFSNRGNTWMRKGDYAQAIRDWKSALTLRTNFYYPQLALATVYATCPDERFRNGQEALKYATIICDYSGWQRSEDLAILAAAYAELGNFEEAINWQTKANAASRGEQERTKGAALLELYKQGKPLRDSTLADDP